MASKTELPYMVRRTTGFGHYFVQQNVETLRDVVDKNGDNMDTSIANLEGRVATLEAGGTGPRMLWGTAQIASGTTSVLVTHNFGSTSYRISIIPTGGDPGARWWAQSRNANDFTIGLGAAPAGAVNFDWIIVG